MRIAQIAPLYESVPPSTYGGTERVVSYLTEELVRKGHEVTLFASGDSVTQARIEPQCPRALRLDPNCHDPLAYHLKMLGEVYQRGSEFDIIHSHADYLSLPMTRLTDTPTVVTLHGRLNIPDLFPLFAQYPEVPLVSISNAQRAPIPTANWAATVYHGLPTDLYTFQPRAGSYLVFVGRISSEKRPDSAIAIAQAAGVPLRIAAKVDAADRDYYEETIRPLMNSPLVEFIGEVNEEQKRDLLAHALALVFPIDWPEPFGLVLIEALACGTPVIARRRGSVPELLRDGETGFVCRTEAEMVQAVRRAGTLSRLACREDFEQRFTAEIMATRYEAVYEALAARGLPLGAAASPTRNAAQRAKPLRRADALSLAATKGNGL